MNSPAVSLLVNGSAWQLVGLSCLDEHNAAFFPAYFATRCPRAGARRCPLRRSRDARRPSVYGACGILSIVQGTFEQRPQPLPTRSDRSTLGRSSCEAPPLRPQVLL